MAYTYSVIIPHKNCQELLLRCLDYIPKRRDIQVIVVDDNSDPTKVDFEELMKLNKDNTTVILDKQSKGAGAARNVGLKYATGRWLVFSDSDDFFTKGAFDEFDKYVDSDYDVVYFKMDSVYSDTLEPANRGRVVNKLVDEYLQNPHNEDGLRYRFVNPVCKIVRASLVFDHNFTYDECPASNDLMFSIKAGHAARKVTAVDFASYCATVCRGSLMNHISITNQRSRYLAYIRQYKFMESIGRKDLRFHLFSVVVHSWQFGFKEFCWYIKTAIQSRVNIFIGCMDLPSKVIKEIRKPKRNKRYVEKDRT